MPRNSIPDSVPSGRGLGRNPNHSSGGPSRTKLERNGGSEMIPSNIGDQVENILLRTIKLQKDPRYQQIIALGRELQPLIKKKK